MDVDDGEAFVENEQEDLGYQEEPHDGHGNPIPSPRSLPHTMFMALVSTNPWYWILFLGVSYYLYLRYRLQINARFNAWRERREEDARTAAVKKNPDLFREKMESMDKARRALQDRYDREAAEAAERERAREEERRRERLQELENLTQGKGYRNKVYIPAAEFSDGVNRTTTNDGASKNKKPIFRPEYNPLMGDGGSSGYRPSRRSGNTGGG